VAVTPPVLFERDAELQVIADLMHRAKHGAGAMVMVEASAGLGKSVLLDHAAASASGAGLLVLRACGHQLERGVRLGYRPVAVRGAAAPWGGRVERVAGRAGGTGASNLPRR
jgi:hypothetical protein